MKCKACGSVNPEEFNFCENCGESLSGILCPVCRHSNLQDMKFCEECGSRLDILICSTCSHENPLDFKFCEECGTSLTDTSLTPRGTDTTTTARVSESQHLQIRIIPRKKRKSTTLPFLFKTILRSLAGSAFGFLAGKAGVWAMNFLFGNLP